MIRRAHTRDPLAPPPLLSPKTESILSLSGESATPSLGSSPVSAKDALLQCLKRHGSEEENHGTDHFNDLYSPRRNSFAHFEICSKPELDPRTRTLRHSISELCSVRSFLEETNNYVNCVEDTAKRKLQCTSAYQNNNNGNSPEDEWAPSSGRSTEVLDIPFQSKNTDDIDGAFISTHSTKSVIISKPVIPSDDIKLPPNDIPQLQVINQTSQTLPRDSRRRSLDIQSCSRDSGISSISHSRNSREETPVAKTSPLKTHVRSVSDFGLPAAKAEEVLEERNKRAQTITGTGKEPTSALLSTDSQDEPAEGSNSIYFPRPTEGQSLMSFLSSQDFHTCAELDKENAHFSISEALIAAIEQMKWNQVIRPHSVTSDLEEGDSDEEIQALKQRIRIRRRERLHEKARGFPAFSDGKTDTGTTTGSSSLLSSSPRLSSLSSDSSDTSGDIHDTEIGEADQNSSEGTSNLTSLRESGLSLSLASLYSDADIQKSLPNERRTASHMLTASSELASSYASSLVSAESVAISLLKKFSEKHLPKASDLEWLVSEQDAPQALLPLPKSFPVSPDEGENADIALKRTRLRGNLEWAPPRAQIIFNIHPAPKRKVVLAKQNYRCAGCGAKVEPGYMKRYRYCEYLGKYFCPRCHTNAVAYIPARVLRKWDFTRYYISNFAADLLHRIQNDALFNVEDINPALYRKVRILETLHDYRVQLHHLKMFIETCRLGKSLHDALDVWPSHWLSEVHVYSLNQLVQVKKGDLVQQMKCLVNDCVAHVSQCPLCQAKGFICELCNDDDIIFPFELSRITQCQECRACYHSDCFIPGKCPKCARIEARKYRLASPPSEEEEEKDSNSNHGNQR